MNVTNHGDLRLIANFKFLIYHHLLYSWVSWFFIAVRHWIQWHLFIYKVILRHFPPYLSLQTREHQVLQSYNLHLQDCFYCLCLKPLLMWAKRLFSLLLHLRGISSKVSFSWRNWSHAALLKAFINNRVVVCSSVIVNVNLLFIVKLCYRLLARTLLQKSALFCSVTLCSGPPKPWS